jgi:hypothetical protein
MRHTVLPIAAVALVLGLAGPTPAHAEIVTVPPAAPSSTAAELPPPTVLRGSPPAPRKEAEVCPPGSIPALGTGCVAPTNGEYAEGWPDYDYWPYDWYGYPGYGFSDFGYRRDRFRRFHGLQSSHRPARFGGFRVGVVHIGGFGRR